ncbi:MipA/OmpV family protein [Mariprofundus sp. EBB-1]|nr:MipA/OmpV family protein [Mariprofundus sp. EBB-1]
MLIHHIYAKNNFHSLLFRHYFCTFIILLLSLPGLAKATENLPKWEVGVALGAISLPQYMGSNERYQLALPLPYFVYRGDRVNVDRGGIRAEILGLKRLTLDASFGGGLSVRNNNRARAGMPELKFSFQFGPRLNWQIMESDTSGIRFRLPWRWSIDTRGQSLGWLSEPELQWQLNPDANTQYRIGLGALYTSEKFNRTYYGVAPQYATATRAAYQAKGGLHSMFVSVSVSHRWSDRVTVFASTRYRNLSTGVVANSPLVKDKNYLTAVVGVSYSIWQSEKKVSNDIAD